jgi:LuxR family maltose regulon positive regulatory protein
MSTIEEVVERHDHGPDRLGLVAAGAGFGRTARLDERAKTTDARAVRPSRHRVDTEPRYFWPGTTVAGHSRSPALADSPALTLETGPGGRLSVMAVRAWLYQYGLDAARDDPEQLLQLVLRLAQLGKPEVQGWLARVEQGHTDPDPFLRALLHCTWAEYHLARGEPERARPHNQVATEAAWQANRHHSLLTSLAVQRARSYLMAGDVVGVSDVVNSPSAPVGHPIVDDVHLPALRAWVALQAGDLRLARRIAEEVFDAANQLGAPPDDTGTILATVVGAALDLEAGRWAAAGRQLSAAKTAAEALGSTDLSSLISRWSARLATDQGHEEAAASYLTEARFAFAAPSQSVRAELAVEELRQAISFAPERGTELLSELPDRVESKLLRARLAISLGEPSAADELLGGLDTAQTKRERVEAGVLRALVAFGHDVPAAHAYLRRALSLGRTEGFWRTVIGQGLAVSGLLRSFSPDQTLAAYTGELITMADAALAPLRQTTVTDFVEQLSSREVTVLRYLPSRLTSHEIAAQLFVSMNTLKTHLKTIYRKLGASSRWEAVDIARAANLI